MNEDSFNMEVRKFLKQVGVTSQREIERAVTAAVRDGRLPVGTAVTAKMTLTVEAVGLRHEVVADLPLA